MQTSIKELNKKKGDNAPLHGGGYIMKWIERNVYTLMFVPMLILLSYAIISNLP